mgnify:CR=1 FL=1
MPGKVFGNDVGMYTYSPGLGNVGAYQVSGIPYAISSSAVTTTVTQVTFPYVTNWVYIVQHTNDDLRIGFSQNGVNGTNFFLLPGVGTNGQSTTGQLPVKVSSLFFRCDNTAKTIPFYVVAGLTGINTYELASSGPSGANWSGSAGVG